MSCCRCTSWAASLPALEPLHLLVLVPPGPADLKRFAKTVCRDHSLSSDQHPSLPTPTASPPSHPPFYPLLPRVSSFNLSPICILPSPSSSLLSTLIPLSSALRLHGHPSGKLSGAHHSQAQSKRKLPQLVFTYATLEVIRLFSASPSPNSAG